MYMTRIAHSYIYIDKLVHHACCVNCFRRESFINTNRKNQRAAEKWRQMSEDDKRPYVHAAKETVDIPADSWGELSRILRNMQNNVCFYI